MNTPIVLLPGIMGSRLHFPNAGKFWDPDSATRMAWWMPVWPYVWPFRSDDDNRRDLHAREPAGVVYDNDSVGDKEKNRGWSTIAWNYYGDMLNQLQSRFGGSGNVFALGYDWRQDIGWLADYAVEKIEGILSMTGADEVVVITHSMGGLLIRAALQNPALAARLKPALKAVIHVCIPAAGAVVIYRRLFTGMLRTFDGGGGIGDRLFRLLLGNTREAFLGNVSGLPGAVQLVPNSFFPLPAASAPWNPFVNPPNAVVPALYAGANCPPGVVPGNLKLQADVIADLRDRVDEVIAFQQAYGNPAAALHPETWLIYGTGLDTESSIAFPGGGVQPRRTPLGDGTVPQSSATSLGLAPARMIPVPKVEHGIACVNPNVLQAVKTALANYLP